MMQAIRTRAGSIVVKVLFVLLIVSFGFWGIYTRSDYFQEHSPETVLATVGGRDIRAEELQQALEPALQRLRAQFGGSIDNQQIKQLGIIDTLLGQLIDRALLDNESVRLGLDPSDDVVRSTIYDNPAFRGADGKFDRQLFGQILAMNRLTEDQLVARLRHDIPRADLLQAVTAGVVMPRPVVDALYRYRNEKRLADIVAFPVASITDIGQPSDADLKKFYDAHPDLFRAPEYRAVTIASLSPADLQRSGSIPDDKLRSEYDQHKDDFGTPEQRDIQQLLAPSEEKAKEAESELAAGKDWKDVAASLGQDADSIDLGLLSRQDIPHELGDVAFDLALNKPSEPVKSPMGWHVLRVTKIDPAKTQTFEEAKAKIETDLKMQDAVDRLDKIGNQADDALAGGGSLADVAAKFGLKTVTISSLDESGHDAEGKPVKLPIAPEEIIKTIFSTSANDTSRITDTQDGAIYAVHVDKVTEPHVKPLADVKDTAVAGWQAEQKRDAATKQAEALAAAVTADAPLAKMAGDKKLTLLAAVPLTRKQTQGQSVPPALVTKLFAAKVGDVVTGSDPTGAFVAQLKEVQSPDQISDAAASGLSDQLADESRADVAGEFTESLRRRFPVEVKREAVDRMF
ncbi:MAG TPA: peptidyl-prolyl cis-trans isomerase [Stellaceae bacterium]|jgi:peptidyl-prolyl cis-trans isomerase D|nr:peptidyl-prolyl cis-trans isomerase [Stellaceae bacterium]